MNKQENLFRIGGHYRNKLGAVVSLVAPAKPEDDFVALSMVQGGNRNGEALHRLTDGVNESEHREYDLIPGELVNILGEWVPMEQSKTDGGSSCFTPDCFDRAHAAILSATEPKRTPLDWATEKRFDPFRDFTVTKGTTQQDKAASKPESLSPDLANQSHQVSPRHATAAVFGKRQA